MQYGTASRKELSRYRRLRSGGIETPDREQAWQSRWGVECIWASNSKLNSVCSVLKDCLIYCCHIHFNTGKLAIAGKGNGRSRVAAIVGVKHMHTDVSADNETLHVSCVAGAALLVCYCCANSKAICV
eukprot:jgi/Botrbrau1/18875/Bobra.177_2s0035.1